MRGKLQWVFAVAALFGTALSGSGYDQVIHKTHSHASLEEGQSATRVLIIGTSYTKNLAKELQQLARQTERPLHVEQRVGPAWNLQQHLLENTTAKLIQDGEWDFVLLEEHSEVSAKNAEQREKDMLPFVQEFAQLATQAGALPIILEAWGFKNGDTQWSSDDTFEEMQARLITGCKHAAEHTGSRIAPVGSAFSALLKHEKLQKTPIQLWQHDGRHASRSGIYLTAAVIYTVIFPNAEHGAQELPLVAPYAKQGGLRPQLVDIMQHVAFESVVGEGKGQGLRDPFHHDKNYYPHAGL